MVENHNLMCTYPVFLPMRSVGNKVSNFGAKVFPDDSSHVMNQIHQFLLLKKKNTQFSNDAQQLRKTCWIKCECEWTIVNECVD